MIFDGEVYKGTSCPGCKLVSSMAMDVLVKW